MKNMLKISFSILAGSMLMASCKKNEIKYGDFELVDPNKAFFKVNFVSSYSTNPSVVFTIDGKRVNNPITSRTPFPGGGLNTNGGSTANYLLTNSGTHSFAVVIPSKVTFEDSIELYKTNIDLLAGKYQTLHITDTLATTVKTIVVDDLKRPDSGVVRYRFINLMPNEPVLNLYFDSTLLAENVKYLESVEFTKAAGTAAPKAGWWARSPNAASGTPAAAAYTLATAMPNTQLNQRVFTVFAMGYTGIVSPDTRRPYLSFVFNL